MITMLYTHYMLSAHLITKGGSVIRPMLSTENVLSRIMWALSHYYFFNKLNDFAFQLNSSQDHNGLHKADT